MTATREQESNREIIRLAFQRWASGDGSFFDLLIPEASWTIMGSGPYARTYHGRQTYLDAAVTPLFARLAAPTVPKLRHMWAVDNSVIVRWDQDTKTCAGPPYRNSYAWFLTMMGGRVIDVTVFLDLPAFERLLASPITERDVSPAFRGESI